MRAKTINMEKTKLRDMCTLCKDNMSLADHSRDKMYSGRITRSIARWLKCLNNFVIIEVYRSMPLLGDEQDIPNWEVHLVRYSVILPDMYT